MKTERTNFSGSWESICPHCGKKQVEHRTTNGPLTGVLYEHRLPCQPEIEKMMRERRRQVRGVKIIIFVGWILVPLMIAVLGLTSAVVGFIAFLAALAKVGIEGIKLFGNPDKLIPGYKKKKERELLERHYIYHCDRNPEGFARLRSENFGKETEEEEVSSKSIQATPRSATDG